MNLFRSSNSDVGPRKKFAQCPGDVPRWTRHVSSKAVSSAGEQKKHAGIEPARQPRPSPCLTTAPSAIVSLQQFGGYIIRHTLYALKHSVTAEGTRGPFRCLKLEGTVATTFFVEVRFLWFLGLFISTFNNRNGCSKFQLLKLSFEKFGCYLFPYVQ